ncbi:sensor histidine kinase [Chachezhania antarctica]|uniref:sensor histidine kinase n=1 Tax=Chachezhania antarctica TaxID=2340860 RepID=UPI000EB59CB0|nr:HAMP domain-containing sensor histidine kinase [Chachezhania antarctica]|tara:strand:- start:11751 stop:12485 length:735 start_codon:yes stop_codon:yes gene_type:complete
MSEEDESQYEIDLTLLANFTHQVINPLNGVAGTLDNLVDGTIGENRREQRMKAARAQLEGVITLVRNLAYLSSAQYEAGQPNRRIALPQVIIEAAMYYQEEGSAKRVSIDLLDKRANNRVPGHPEALRQVLMNLFDNAVKYSATDSQIVVRQWIQTSTGDAVITVRNTPRNLISGAEIRKVFDLGFRGENARRSIASGTGLGLYICKLLMEDRLHGSISVQRDGDGILFTLKIPNGEADNGRNN